jgi:hypothetical protein
MGWLVDHANTIYLVLGAVALGFAAAFWLNKRVKFLAIAGGVLALIGLFWLLTQWVVTDRGQIRRNLDTMASAVVDGDADRLFKYVAADFQYQGMSRKQLYEAVSRTIKFYNITDIPITNTEIESLSRETRSAKVTFNATVHGPEGPRPFLLRTDFVLEGEVWKIRAMRIYNPLVNTDQEITVPLR